MFQEFDFATGKTVDPRRRQVIIVLNEADQADQLQQLLRQKSYPIKGNTSDLREGLAMIGKHKLGLLFLDADLEGVDALELMGKIRKSFSDFKIIVVTSQATKEMLTQVMEAGASGFLVKPIGQEALNNVLERLWK